MSDSANPAVFLSYASQDAEAVRRIAAALRGAGVEVWFDQNELVGGDAWDAKIRGQIASCALFVPVISAATQARREGYFRIEWKLAAQRTHAMADGTPFLLPVVIDATRDAEALVPAEFRALQWTRLPSGETPEKFCARVKKLLESSTGVSPVSVPVDSEPGRDARATVRTKPSRPWLVPALAGVAALAAVALWRPWVGTEAIPPAAAAVPALSEANRLVAKAWEQMDKTEMARNELLLAEGFCRQAAALDETNPSVWAAWSAMNTWFYFHQFERLPARKEAARDFAQKALALDAKSYEARYAWAHFIVRMAAAGKIGDEKPALPILRELLRERPDEPRALYALGFGLVADPANADEGFVTLERLAEKHPWFAGRALNEVGWMALFYGRLGLAESSADRALKAQPYWNNLGLKATLALRLRGDVELAQTMINRLPPTALQENWGISLAVTVADWRGDHERAVAILQGVSRDWLENFFYFGPTSFLSGWMRLKAKQVTAAEKDFRRALELIALRLDKTPNDAPLLWCKAESLRLLGMREEAEKTYRQLREVWPSTMAQVTFEPPEQALNYVRQRVQRAYQIDDGTPGFWFTAASLRLDPMFENARRAPGFQAVVEEAEQREKLRWSRATPSAAAKASAAFPAESSVTQKSVAVLAFRNLSDAQTSDYFSDGLSEELGNVLGRVPGLRVAGSTSAFSFKGKAVTLPEIARQLGVAYLVEGSVQREGSDVRITAKLINGADGLQVWTSGNLNREVKKVLAVQEEIAGLIAKELSLKLGVTSAAATMAVNPRAFELYLQGRQAWNLRTTAGFDRAEALFNQTLEIEPAFARAHAALADVWITRGLRSGSVGRFGQRASSEQARIVAKAREALKLDPDSAEAHTSLGSALWHEWNRSEAEKELRRAIALNPNYATAHQWLGGILDCKGQPDEAMAEAKLAAELDPLSPIILSDYGMILYTYGRYSEAIPFFDRALRLQADAAQAISGKARALLKLGQTDAAVALIRQLPTDSANNRARIILVLGTAGLKAEAEALMLPADQASPGLLLVVGRRDEAIAALDESVVRSTAAVNLLVDPIYDSIRDHPRFQRLIATLGLTEAHARAQAWRAAHPPEQPAQR